MGKRRHISGINEKILKTEYWRYKYDFDNRIPREQD